MTCEDCQLDTLLQAKRLRDLEAQLAAAKRMRLGLPDDMSDLDTSDSEESDSEQERQDGNDAGPSPKGVSSDHGADAPAEPPSASMPQANEDAAAARPDGEAGAGLSSRGKGCGAEGEAEAGGGSKEGDVAAEVDVEAFESVEDLEGLGMDVLKRELGRRGMKTGGTLRQRAERLFLLKGRTIADIEPKHLAAARRGKK